MLLTNKLVSFPRAFTDGRIAEESSNLVLYEVYGLDEIDGTVFSIPLALVEELKEREYATD